MTLPVNHTLEVFKHIRHSELTGMPQPKHTKYSIIWWVCFYRQCHRRGAGKTSLYSFDHNKV